MTTNALNALWVTHSQIRRSELQYWSMADRLIEQGLVDIYDVTTIYGVCADTARKRLRNLRDGRNLGPGIELAPFYPPVAEPDG